MNDPDDPGANEPRLDLSALRLSHLEKARLLGAIEQPVIRTAGPSTAGRRSRAAAPSALLDVLGMWQPHARRLVLASLTLTLCAMTLCSIVPRPRPREPVDWIESLTILRSGADVRRYWLEARGARR
jgi:hypothetical protein